MEFEVEFLLKNVTLVEFISPEIFPNFTIIECLSNYRDEFIWSIILAE